MPTVGVHEAYPGHHTQFGRANRAATLARRVAFIPDGGMLLIEGWAFYCEEMMEAQGFLAAPAVRLMRLNDQLWRACRVVIDMELNLGLMSFDQAVDFLSSEAHIERPSAELEVRWYSGAPGYPMAYLIGKREIMALGGRLRPPPVAVAQGLPRRAARMGRDDAGADPPGDGARTESDFVAAQAGAARCAPSPPSDYVVGAQAGATTLRA